MNELARMRTEAGVTQEQIARVLGLSGKTPHNWERQADDKVKPFQLISYEAAIATVTGTLTTSGGGASDTDRNWKMLNALGAYEAAELEFGIAN